MSPCCLKKQGDCLPSRAPHCYFCLRSPLPHPVRGCILVPQRSGPASASPVSEASSTSPLTAPSAQGPRTPDALWVPSPQCGNWHAELPTSFWMNEASGSCGIQRPGCTVWTDEIQVPQALVARLDLDTEPRCCESGAPRMRPFCGPDVWTDWAAQAGARRSP